MHLHLLALYTGRSGLDLIHPFELAPLDHSYLLVPNLGEEFRWACIAPVSLLNIIPFKPPNPSFFFFFYAQNRRHKLAAQQPVFTG